MLKHGSSHSLSILTCTIISAILIKYIEPYFPKVISPLEKIAQFLVNYLHVPISKESLTVILVASILGIVWGIVFKLRFVD